MAESGVIREFLVGLGFKIDKGGQENFVQAIEGVTAKVMRLRPRSKEPPAQVRYIRSFDRLSFVQSPDGLLAHQVGIDPIYTYLSTALARWGGTHRAGSRVWMWRDPAVDESVTLIYSPPSVLLRRRAPHAEHIIVRYTSPRAPAARYR